MDGIMWRGSRKLGVRGAGYKDSNAAPETNQNAMTAFVCAIGNAGIDDNNGNGGMAFSVSSSIGSDRRHK